MSFTPRHLLITGGAGFIGSHFVDHLLAHDRAARVVTLDALTYAGSRDNLAALPDASRHILVHGDICDRALVDRLLREHDIDTVVHFAAESHVDRSISAPAQFIVTNLVGTYTLLEACRLFWREQRRWGEADCRFHHISTDEVFGTLGADDPAFTETTPYAPNSPYSASKAGSDHLVRAYHHSFGLPVVTSNCSNNFGPRQHPEKFIPTVIRCCLEGKPVPVYGNGRNVRDWLYVADHCSGIDAVLRRGRCGASYNIGAGNEWANLDLARLLCKLMDQLRHAGAPHERLLSFVTDRPGHDWRYAMDSRLMQAELGWKAQRPFEDALRETLRWYAAR